MIYFTLAAAFLANHAVLASADPALSQRSSSSSSMFAMSTATASESAVAAPLHHRGTAGQDPAPNSFATGTETAMLPAISPPTGTKKGVD